MASPFRGAVKAIQSGTPAEKKDGDLTLTDARGWKVVFGTRSDDNDPRDFKQLVLDAFRGHPVAAPAIREIQTSVSEARLYAYEKEEGGEIGERLTDSDAENIVWFPNLRDTYVSLVERLIQHFLLGGNAFLKIDRMSTGQPTGLFPIRPDRVVGARTDENNIPIYYRVTDAKSGREDRVETKDFIHIPDSDPLNDVFGTPRLLAASREVSTDRDASNYVGEILQNHGTPGIIIKVSEDVNQAEIDRAEEKFTEKFGPGRGRGKASFIAGGKGVHNVGFSLDDLEFTGLRAITREGICAALGVDPKLINIGSAQKGGSSMGGTEHKEARNKLWAQTIMPLLRRIEAALNKELAPEFGENIIYRFDVSEVEALKESQNDRVERAASMSKSRAFTSAEIRAEAGHAPEPADDDDSPIIGQRTLQAIPQEDYGKGLDLAPEDDGGDDGGGGSDPGDDDDDGEERALPPVIRLTLLDTLSEEEVYDGKGLTFSAAKVESDDDAKEVWKQFDAFARSRESEFERPARQQFELERREIVSLARNTLSDSDTDARANGWPEEIKVIDEDSLDEFKRRLGRLFDDYHEDWRRRYESLTRQSTRVVGAQVAGELGVNFSVFSERVAEFIRERPNLLAGRVTDATFGAIQESLEIGLRAGDSTQEIATRINNVFGQGLYRNGVQVLSAEQRAALIARTETTAVTNGAAMATVADSDVGVDYWKVWLSQGDDRVREEHLFMEGERVEVKAEFSNGLEYPSEPNCRCTTLYEQKGSDSSEGF